MTMTETMTLSLGQQLKNAREALNLTIEDVARKTNLKKIHLEAIENDIFILPSVPPAFVRGYVRNYVRFLRLPETLVNSVNYGEVTIPKEVRKAAPIAVKNHKSQMRWVKGLTWIVLLSAVGMTLAWWWQEHQKDQANREQLIVNTTEATAKVAEEPQQAVTLPAENAVPATPATVAESSTPVAVEQAEPVQSVQTEPVLIQTEVTPPVQTGSSRISMVISPNSGNVTPQVSTEIAVPTQTEQPLNILQATQTEASNQTEEPAQTAVEEELRIEITGAESWITVRTAQNKRLAERLYKAGEVLSFNDNEQYRLTVGAPANVKIYYKGQVVPLKVDGRVARFKLPLAE
ncbi:RodZ domain-containing protein [Glaesserella parasuis]|uniref:RodZ domain-containing protein n=1 Tax=Glaesserella parasuis TaxID=738 RepID=UPI000993597A|nr:RodZ domain-containing protein [Glaesserella parasuis]STO81451.1 transcriptional regulator with an N-terminal xre-type HTH domain [Glaesserella parasuis]